MQSYRIDEDPGLEMEDGRRYVLLQRGLEITAQRLKDQKSAETQSDKEEIDGMRAHNHRETDNTRKERNHSRENSVSQKIFSQDAPIPWNERGIRRYIRPNVGTIIASTRNWRETCYMHPYPANG